MADFYLAACERLPSVGIDQYEISNFAREGFESRHNLKYWTRQPYFGFGVDAHSMLLANREAPDFSCAIAENEREPGFSPRNYDNEAVRFASADSLERYMAGVGLQRIAVPRRAALEESFFLGLRLNRGGGPGARRRKIGGKAGRGRACQQGRFCRRGVDGAVGRLRPVDVARA